MARVAQILRARQGTPRVVPRGVPQLVLELNGPINVVSALDRPVTVKAHVLLTLGTVPHTFHAPIAVALLALTRARVMIVREVRKQHPLTATYWKIYPRLTVFLLLVTPPTPHACVLSGEPARSARGLHGRAIIATQGVPVRSLIAIFHYNLPAWRVRRVVLDRARALPLGSCSSAPAFIVRIRHCSAFSASLTP